VTARRTCPTLREKVVTPHTLRHAAAMALLHRGVDLSVIALWHDVGSVVTPTLLPPVAFALLGRGRLGSRATLALMLVPFGVSLGWVLSRSFSSAPVADYPWSIEPIYAGLGASFLVWLAGFALIRREAHA
jgi:hypothetical protein